MHGLVNIFARCNKYNAFRIRTNTVRFMDGLCCFAGKKHDLICGITYMHCRKRMKAQRVAV
jgi:hypothetical protein